MLACQLSKQAKAPVHLMLTRKDEFLLAGNRSGSWQKFKAGATRDGRLVALRATQYRLGGLGRGSQAGQPYIYTAANFYREVFSVHTHEDASRAMRAPGHPQANFAMESLMDELAYKLELDPIALRLRNYTDADPETGHPWSSKSLKQCYAQGAARFGWSKRKARPVAVSRLTLDNCERSRLLQRLPTGLH